MSVCSISFYPGTKTLNVQGSKSEIIGQKLLQFASTGSEEQSHFAASNIQTNFVSDDDHEQQEGVEEHETLTSVEITEDLNAHTKCSKVIEAAIREFRLEVGKLRSEFAERTARRSDETRLHDENRDLKQKLQEIEMQYDSLERESRAIQDENKSLLTALRLLSSEIANGTKHTAPELNVLADGEWTQAKSSKRVKQSTPSLSSNKNYDQADENKEAAHASPQTTEHSAEQSGTQQSKGKRSVLLMGDSMIKAIEEQKLSKSQSVKKICSRGAKITAIKDQLTPPLQHTAYDSVIIHAGKNDLNESKPEDVIKGLTEMAEEAIKIRSIKVSVSELISQRDENANEKIMHINHTIKAVCVSRGWLFIDNARIKVEHLKNKNKGIHLNGDGVKILASNFIRQALKAKIKAGNHKRKRDPLWLLAQTLNKIIRTSSAS